MSAQFPTFIYGLFVISALVLTLRVVSILLVLLLAPGLTMLTQAYLESLLTTTIDPLTLLFRHTRYLLHFTGFLSLNESLSSSPA